MATRGLIFPFLSLLLGASTHAASATRAQTCAGYNQQSRISAERLNRELLIANSPLQASDLAAGRNPKLAAYMEQFAPDVQTHGLQGRPEPASLVEVKAHYQHVMGSASSTRPDPESALKEDLHVVAGPMAAHRYHAALHVPGFPPDFAYYDAGMPLRLRGQTVFDYGGPDGTIRERWSNHDNKFRTGQLWRYMLGHPRDPDPARFRTDLQQGDDAPGALIDRDGDRLNAVFNGELALGPGDFGLVDGAFRYGPPHLPADASGAITEADGLQFVKRWFSRDQFPVDATSGLGWLADDATLHGAGCDDAAAADTPARIGGTGSGQLAALTLQRLLGNRLGQDVRNALLQAVDPNAPYGQLPISAWSRVAFQTQLSALTAAGGASGSTVQYCAQWIMSLRASSASSPNVKAQEVWLNLVRLDAPGAGCTDALERDHDAARSRECAAHPAWCATAAQPTSPPSSHAPSRQARRGA